MYIIKDKNTYEELTHLSDVWCIYKWGQFNNINIINDIIIEEMDDMNYYNKYESERIRMKRDVFINNLLNE